MGVWGRSPQPLETIAGYLAKPPDGGGWGSGKKDPIRRRHRGLEVEPPAFENLACVFAKITQF